MKHPQWNLLSLIFGFVLTSQAHAAAQLRDVGIIGLMSHDIFAWDREHAVNTENGRLDLSTIFEYNEGRSWSSGGDPKNCENSPVCTITLALVKNYEEELAHGNAELARKKTVVKFQAMVLETYQRLSGLPSPTEASSEPVNNLEQSALRGMHDILPGQVKLFHRLFKTLTLTNPLFAKLQLNEDELNQELRPFDGDYDRQYKEIKIPFTTVVINLMEIDRKFIETYSPYRQADILTELAKVGSEAMSIQDTFFFHHISDLIAKGLCSKGNPWMPTDRPCP